VRCLLAEGGRVVSASGIFERLLALEAELSAEPRIVRADMLTKGGALTGHPDMSRLLFRVS